MVVVWYAQSARRPGEKKKDRSSEARKLLRWCSATTKAKGKGECRRRRKCGSKSTRVGSAVRQYVRTVPYLPSSLTAVCAPPSLGLPTVGRRFHH